MVSENYAINDFPNCPKHIDFFRLCQDIQCEAYNRENLPEDLDSLQKLFEMWKLYFLQEKVRLQKSE